MISVTMQNVRLSNVEKFLMTGGADIGPKSISAFQDIIKKSKTILWNGPMGVFEFQNLPLAPRPSQRPWLAPLKMVVSHSLEAILQLPSII